ncbi:DUF4360 domain-containing protein [Streptomyces sp. NPDC127038]|uniref:DUF4360 domain-containing protein n=1 Tax=Streptomyces sp. NPDC127038 TaxID=3347114 RepID=UPI003648CB71
MVLRALAAAGVATSLFGWSASGAGAATPRPPDRIVVDSVAANGTGCPQGTAAVAVSPDGSAFSVTYSNYLAQVGPGSAPADSRKNCQLDLAVHVPGGLTYAIVSTQYNGFASLAPGASGTQRASYHLQGNAATSKTHNFAGGFTGDWQTTDTVPVAALVFAPCGQESNLDINTELQVDPGTSSPGATSFLGMDSTNGTVKTVYHVALKKCQ